MIDRLHFQTDVAAGAAGSATSTTYSLPICGKIQAVHIDYQDSPPATTDVTLSDENDPAAEAIISLANANTDIKIYPRRVTEKNDGADILYTTGEEVYEPYVVHGRLKVVIAQADPADYLIVTVWYEH
jgi:hypothetical protein